MSIARNSKLRHPLIRVGQQSCAPRRIPQLRPGASARPLFGRDVTQGGENPAQADYGSAITAGAPPYSRRNRAAKSRGALSRLSRPGVGERQSRAAAPQVAWAGRRGRGPLARTAGSGTGGGGRRLTARNLQPYAYLNRRGERALSAPAQTRPPSRGTHMRDFGAIVRCRGRSSGWPAWPRGKTAGRNRGLSRPHSRAAVAGRPAGPGN